MAEQLERFITLLKGIFELDKSDLDFGIYRIMNIRKKEIEKFLAVDLPKKVQEALKPFATDTAEAEARIKEIETQLGGSASIAALPPTVPMVKEYAELKTLLAKGVDLSGLEADVYSHLYSFFNRYYEDGDFISKRRYKEGVYAIPYEGEEVKLYWANQDQYYIKTSENFKDYTFVAEGYTIHFKLVDATTEQNNNKESADSKRVFMLYTEAPGQPEQKTFEFNAEKKEFFIRFIFDVPPDKKFDYAADNAEKIKNWIAANNKQLRDILFVNVSSDPKKQLTLIEKHLKAYAAKNSFDYFIHKDLHKFLSRELDFYIKNEVMHLDDVDTPNEKQVSTYLAKIRAIKRVGNILIEFLASIEDFQKKLWLKKKFVVQCDYCITLDRIPEEFYPEIAACDEQREEWVKLCTIDRITAQQGGMKQGGEYINEKGNRSIAPHKVAGRKFGYSVPLEVGFLKENRFLMVDTKFFNDDFKSRLLASFDDFDKQCDGLLIHSENFQALHFIKKRFKNTVDGIYIDPPYNATSSEILYKNTYKHSAWMALLKNRLEESRTLLRQEGITTVAIDDYELPKLWELMNQIYGYDNHLGTVTIRINPKGRMTARKISAVHEYTLLFGNTDTSFVKKLPENPEEKTHNYKQDEFGHWYLPNNLRKQGVDSEAEKSDGTLADRYFPIYFDATTGKVSSKEHLPITIWPVDSSGYKRIWRRGKDAIDDMYKSGEIWVSQTKNGYQVYYKFYGGLDGKMIQSIWTEPECSASDYGTKILDNILGKRELFSYPKAPYAVQKNIMAMTASPIAYILDFFAGSGTTAQALISLNRNDKGKRKYILVEMGNYFETVTKARIEKVIYASDWKDGFPKETPSIKGKHIIEETKKVLKNNDGEEELTGFSTSYKGTEIEANPDWKEDNPFNGISHCFKYLTLESYEDALSNVTLPDEKTTGRLRDLFGEEYLVKYMLNLNTAGDVLNLDKFEDPFNYKLKVTEKNETKEVNVDLMETFNYLIGLTVEKLYARNTFTATPDLQGEYEGAVKLTEDKNGKYTFRQIEGKLPDGRRCLILWRNMTENLTESNATLDAYFRLCHINPSDKEYDIIYVNGDNNLERAEGEAWKISLIETEFKKRMFEED